MKAIVLGLVLVAGGVALLVFHGVPYKTEEKVLDVGPLHATAEREHTIEVPPWAGAAIVGAGALVLVVGARRRK